MQKTEYSIEIGDKKLTVECTDLAEQANGSVVVRYGDTVLLATVVISEKDREGVDFFPLIVDYEERFYALGKILGSRFARREGKPSDEAVLHGRIIDRTIRPLFDQRLRREVQVIITTLSVGENEPDMVAVMAASLALGISPIPWNGPVSAVRIRGGKKGDNEFTMVACGKDGMINMIEMGGCEIANEIIVSTLQKASEEIEKLQEFQRKIIAERGTQKMEFDLPELSDSAKRHFTEEFEPRLDEAVFTGKAGKKAIESLKSEWLKVCKTEFADEISLADAWFEEEVNVILHTEAIEKGRRADGRALDQVRTLYAQAGGISPMLHGTGIFYRGETHIFSVVTLGGPNDGQANENAPNEEAKRFMHHYNFAPFSVGETGRLGGANRRAIGHGALAEKALVPVIPSKELFPYTIRVVSETMSSNGSSSMASVCAASLALMDSGVPISTAVAGIASGLMIQVSKKGVIEKYALLTDIQGPEDHHGDMDFKVAGTSKGITAIQMDVKVSGVPVAILAEALEKTCVARMEILSTMQKTIAAPRLAISTHAPKILSFKINPDHIGLVIGPGGKMIKSIKEKTGADIDIKDDGTIFITGFSKNTSTGMASGSTAAESAKILIENITKKTY